MDSTDKTSLHDSPQAGGLKMDSSVKKRFRRSSKFYSNPLSPSTPISINKKRNIDDISIIQKLDLPFDSEPDENWIPNSKEIIDTSEDKEELWKMYSHLKKVDAECKEKLRKLQLVRQHQNKNTPDDLVSLIQKWLTAGQASLRRLYEVLPEPKPDDLQSLMDHLQIDADILKYNPENDTFSLK